MIKKILFADSGTGQVQDMLKNLLRLPAFRDTSINILHVVKSKVTPDAAQKGYEEGGKLLAQALQDLKLDPRNVNTILRQGEPKDIVRAVAEEIDADLILMGSRGLKRLQSILSNSVSQYVFQLTNRPMLLVKDDIFVRTLKKVMVAIDKSDASMYGLELALQMMRDYKGCEIILLRVNPDLPSNLQLSQADMDANPTLARAIKRAKQMGVKHRNLVVGGRPGATICTVAEEQKADLLVLGSPDRRPSVAKNLPDLDRLLGTSLSDYVRVNATCPVLLARTESPE
ncbi:UspA domain-containing protein [[Leptolyngbya] sp. PCC 7376]|uniref:universal stress protein n=1 Tax=[Leptolyngbya] sp. PCC 7376 TaxID=111781 RepID=UPI00029F4BDA|nr:universal stress protein [[Leptolyngbya] sp. PCC 7376]AFY37128.1 UspA domain-containing protein [[Leptolyngbya] sp. PCC 7376]